MRPIDLKNFGKAPIRPAPSRIQTGSDPGGGELLLNLAISTGEASGWYEVIRKELERNVRAASRAQDRKAGRLMEAPSALVRRELHEG